MEEDYEFGSLGKPLNTVTKLDVHTTQASLKYMDGVLTAGIGGLYPRSTDQAVDQVTCRSQ